ncbi:major facilitator superfamily domain-containing protein [Naematelia encephala]|uniref:Major facilitator superfamily domain-containing protein n=1 Tax=Naematelia encephala TaxID=71784 RepID=A0A1Y2AWG9_9TREE|nr:major facilitator superfamily domain-containing protein [Naematelia encephala]
MSTAIENEPQLKRETSDTTGFSGQEKQIQTVRLEPTLDTVDEGYEVYVQTLDSKLQRTPEAQAAWDATSKRVARKFDHWLLAMMCFMVGVNYIDKAALAWAVLFGFKADLNLVGKDYNWISSMFYFGYLAGQIPSVYLTARAPLAKVIGISTIIWGVLMLGSMGCKTYGQMLAIRFLLGVFEAPLVPSLVSYTALFYTRKENAARTLIWGAMQGAFYLVFSLVAYGLGHINNTALRQWAWIFLVIGLLSVVLGAGWVLFMPDTPMKARFLTEEEKVVSIERTAENMYGTQGHVFQWKQILECFWDPLYYITLIYVFFETVPNGISSFNTLVISSFGFNQFNTLLVGLPSSIVSAGSLITWSFLARKYGGLRTIGLAVPLIPAIAGMASVYATTYGDYSKWGRVVAYWLVNSYAVCWPFTQAHIGVNFAGHTKRSFVYGSSLVFFATGNIVGPFIFPSGSSNYSKALGIILAFFCIQFLLAGVIRAYMVWDNRRRDKLYGPVDTKAITEGALEGLQDRTDRENKSFRYVL